MDKDALELNLEQDGDQVALMLSIPVIRAKDEDEIKAALEAEDKQKESEENEENLHHIFVVKVFVKILLKLFTLSQYSSQSNSK